MDMLRLENSDVCSKSNVQRTSVMISHPSLEALLSDTVDGRYPAPADR